MLWWLDNRRGCNRGFFQLDLFRAKYERISRRPHALNIVSGGFKANPNRAGAAMLGFFNPTDVFESLDSETYQKFRHFLSFVYFDEGLPRTHERHETLEETFHAVDILDGKRRASRYLAWAELHSRGDLVDAWVSRHPSPRWLGLLIGTNFVGERIDLLLKNTPDAHSLFESLYYALRNGKQKIRTSATKCVGTPAPGPGRGGGLILCSSRVCVARATDT